MDVELEFEGTGASYPADLMVSLYDPSGECIVWGGWTAPTDGCVDAGTGFAGTTFWPDSWNSSATGIYSNI